MGKMGLPDSINCRPINPSQHTPRLIHDNFLPGTYPALVLIM